MQGIYVWTNKRDGKQYVGKSKNLSAGRPMKHFSPKAKGLLAEAIREQGLECFSLELRAYPNLSQDELAGKERELVLELGTLKPNGYNSRLPNPDKKHRKRYTKIPVKDIPPEFYFDYLIDGLTIEEEAKINRRKQTQVRNLFSKGKSPIEIVEITKVPRVFVISVLGRERCRPSDFDTYAPWYVVEGDPQDQKLIH